MTTGPEMLLKAALSAFVPKQTAENIAVAIEGMLKDGSLDGIGSLVADVAEIKRSQARIEFGLARIFAALHPQQQVHSARAGDDATRSAADGLVSALVTEQRPIAATEPGDGGDAGGVTDGVGCGDNGNDAVSSNDDRSFGQPHHGHGSEAAE